MITITVVNWLLIIFLMLTAYRFDVVGNLPTQPTNARYLMPTIHAVLGLPAQLLATYIIYRMLREDSQVAAAKARGEKGQQLSKYWFKSAKPVMRLTIILWLVTSLLGVFNYLIRYNVLPTFASNRAAPAVTAEPAATTEPAATAEPATTTEPSVTAEPAATTEPAVTTEPIVTSEVMVTEEASSDTPTPRPTDKPAATSAPATTAEPAVTPEVTP